MCTFANSSKSLKLGYNYSTRDDTTLNNLPTPSMRATIDTTANVAVLLEEPLSDFLMANFTLKVCLYFFHRALTDHREMPSAMTMMLVWDLPSPSK